MLHIRINQGLLIFFQLQIIYLASPGFSIRLDVSLQEKQTCRTTVQGRYLLSDENGYVCDALSLDPQSRCCRGRGEQYSCHGCNLDSNCCNSYEFCVSCCLSPARTQKDLALKVKIAKPTTAGTYSSVFDYCAGRCRHNSESVVHENAYFSDFHHCFALPSNSSGVTDRLLEVRLSGINVIVGKQGESCDTVCKSNGQSCVPNKLILLNQCEMLQYAKVGYGRAICVLVFVGMSCYTGLTKLVGAYDPCGDGSLHLSDMAGLVNINMLLKYMNCRGGCLASIGMDQPAEVVNDAPKNLNPGACLYTKKQSVLSCDGSHRHTRRLCPCA